MSAEEYIEIGYLAKESIKASTSKMSPEEGNKLIQAGITTTPHKGDMFPDSIRESPTPNEASQASWHDRNFPKSHVSNIQSKITKFQNFINISPQVDAYYTPSSTSNAAETGKSSCRMTSTDTSKGGSQVRHSDSQNHEVISLTNNVH